MSVFQSNLQFEVRNVTGTTRLGTLGLTFIRRNQKNLCRRCSDVVCIYFRMHVLFFLIVIFSFAYEVVVT